MTILVGSARRRSLPDPDLPVTGPPYNAASTLTVPTYEGSGYTVHPSVVDMGEPWNGYRYWLADTPFPAQNDDYENPSIFASHDGLTWVVPDGLTNPIDPWPGGPGYNSDTELVYDPEAGRMICFWRDWNGAGTLIFCCSESTDGISWTPQQNLVTLPYSPPNVAGAFSPAVWRNGPGDWFAWFIGENNYWQLRTATDPTGEWSAPTNLTFNGTPTGGLPGTWHGDVVKDSSGIYRAISSAPKFDPNAIYLASSLDGIAWSGWTILMSSRNGEWDEWLYRASIVPYQTVMRCWYSAFGPDNQPRIGHTILPISLWPDPPTT